VEAAGQQDAANPTPKVRKYWAHPVHSKIEGENYFSICYKNI